MDRRGFRWPRALSYGAIDALRRDTLSFVGVSGYNTMVLPVETPDGARINPTDGGDAGFFQMLGVSAEIGRLIGPDDAKAPVAVVNDEFWRDRLHGNPKAIGAAITISGKHGR